MRFIYFVVPVTDNQHQMAYFIIPDDFSSISMEPISARCTSSRTIISGCLGAARNDRSFPKTALKRTRSSRGVKSRDWLAAGQQR